MSHTSYLFDGIGRLRRETLSYPEATAIGGSTRDFTYDGLGRRIKESMWEDFTLTQDFSLDRFGRVTTIDPADPNLAETIVRYTGDRLIDRTTKVATETDGSETWVCTREEYDALGRLVKVTENRGSDAQGSCSGSGFDTFYSYDEADRLTRVCAGGGSPCGQERLFTYDNRGFLTSERHPEIGPSGNGTINYAYNANGNVLAKTIVGSPNFSLNYRYDDANRLVGVDQFDAATNTVRPLKSFHYARANNGTDKRAGKLVRSTRTNWVDLVDPISNLPGTLPVALSQAYRYQGLDGRVSQRQTRYTFGGFHFAFDTGFAYDPLGNLNSLAYPECLNAAKCPPGVAPERTVTFDYTRGYLSGIPGYADAIYYQLGGMLNAVEHANGVTETITHADSNLQRPKRIATSGVSNGNWDTDTYVYDGAGNIKAIGTQAYRYDRMSRLTRGEVDSVGASNSAQGAVYDAYGNITRLTTGGVIRDTLVAPATNRMTAGTYDAGGNLTAISHGTEQYEYVYDALNMMTSLRSNTDQARIFIYDADDERIVTFDCALTDCDQRSRTTYTLRDLGGRVLRVFEDLPNEPFTWKRDYVYRGSQLLASVQPSPGGGPEQTLHLHLDHLGTPRQVTNSNATEVAFHSYYPFGGEATDASQNEVALKFTGHERDENGSSGDGMLDYMHARYCSPGLGRFVSVDPVLGATGDPQSWNRFAYVRNNPMRYVDPRGEERAQIYLDAEINNYFEKGIEPSFRDPGLQKATFLALTLVLPTDELAIASLAAPRIAASASGFLARAGKFLGRFFGKSDNVPAAADETFEILDGVRRSKSAEFVGNKTIPGEVIETSGRSRGIVDIPIDSLRSPKSTIDISDSRSADRFFKANLEPARAGSVPPPIQVTPGKNGTRIRDVVLDPHGDR